MTFSNMMNEVRRALAKKPSAELVGRLNVGAIDVWKVLKKTTVSTTAVTAERVMPGDYVFRDTQTQKTWVVRAREFAAFKDQVIPKDAPTYKTKAWLRDDLIAAGFTKELLKKLVTKGKLREGFYRKPNGQRVRVYAQIPGVDFAPNAPEASGGEVVS